LSAQTVIQFRRGSAYLWNNANPILAEGEAGFEIDTGRLKIGNGYSTWTELTYIGSDEAIQPVINTNIYTIQKGQAVYAKSVENGQMIIDQYIANNTINKYKFIGLLSSNLGKNGIGTAIYYGNIVGLDTRGTKVSSISAGGEVWTPGIILYAHGSQPGKLTSIKPKNAIIVGTVLNVNSINGSIFIRSYLQGSLSELDDTNITSNNLINKNLLKYDPNLNSWTPSNIIDGGII
jgi:hypothetical protein